MYRAYLVPDATQYESRAEMYQDKLLLWDPRSESDAYAVVGIKSKGEFNKAESFEFTILPSNIRYEQIKKKISVVIIYDDDEWIAEGLVSDCPKDFYKQMKVTCSGPLSYLCDTVQAPDEKNEVVVPTASGTIYVQVPEHWYNNSNPMEQGWYERSAEVNGDGQYTYTSTQDRIPASGKVYYYASSGDNMNHSGTTLIKKAATKETIQTHLSRLLDVHNSQIEAYKKITLDRCVNDTKEYEFKSSNYRETWSAIKSDIIDQYGRYIVIKMDSNYMLKLDYLELNDMDPHTTPEASIEFTENMLEVSENDDSDDDIFTVLVPTGKDNLTIANLSGHTTPEYNDGRMIDPYAPSGDSWGGNRRYIVVSNAAVRKYGYIVKTQSFSDVEKDDVNELWSRAVKYIKNNFDTNKEYDVKGIDMHILDSSKTRITVGKKCRVKSGWHGIDEKSLFVISAEHDLINPENDVYKIGIPTSDREATNKTLTGQTTSAAKSSKNTGAGLSSGLNTVSSWLESWFTSNEDWLILDHKFRNQVESENGMFRTRFEQDEEHINLVAQKIFGVAGSDDVDNQDAGWILIPKPPYRRSGQGVEDYYETSNPTDVRYKVPSEHNWYVKGADGKYTLATQDTRVTQAQINDPNVNFYIMRLASRYSDLDVGPEGIKGRVDGNYERSTYCSSWIDSNEDSILALTGHLYVDEDGHVHVTSGSGMRTDHQEDGSTLHYYQVARSLYKNDPSSHNPSTEGWYERKTDSSGAWVGLNKNDQETNGEYYIRSSDTTANSSKYYYATQYLREEFIAEYGVYDQDSLTAGIVSRLINYPQYHVVDAEIVKALKNRNGSPREQGWYVYDKSKGTFGITLDTECPERYDVVNDPYYTVENVTQQYSDIWGEHVVVGRTKNYAGMDAATRARVDKYIANNNLDGTITEIASDVVVVNTLLAKYIEADEIVADTSLSTDNFDFNDGMCFGSLEFWTSSGYAQVGTSIDWDFVSTNNVETGAIAISSAIADGDVIFGSGYTTLGAAEDPANIVVGFGAITTEGDTVKIPYYLAGDSSHVDTGSNANILSFDKPASLGAVTWSSGNNTLTVKTAGGKDFLVGRIANYTASNQSEAQQMANAGYLATETTGYNQVYGLYYAFKNAAGNDVQAKTMLFKTPKDRYEDGKTDGISEAKGKFGLYGPGAATASDQTEAIALNNAIILSYGSSYMVHKTYDGSILGSKTYFKTPSDRYNTGYDDAVDTLAIDPTSDKTLDYSGSVTVKAKVKKRDGTYSEKSITVTAPGDNSESHSIDIPNNGFDVDTSEPSGTKLTNMRNAINEAIRDKKWFYFTVNCGDSSKKYYMDFT